MLAATRAFFAERNICEVDCPALTQYAPIDEHIDPMEVHLSSGEKRYLHTSPEYGMKRLLAAGSGDIYQLSHVFRAGEQGALHNPEFTMIEWYRTQMALPAFIEETLALIHLFLGALPTETLPYRTLFKLHTGIDAIEATTEDLRAFLQARGVVLSTEWDKDGLLQLILNQFIEPTLGQESLFVLTDFPTSQAALARITPDQTAARFEIYHQGIELANGYHELADAAEQERRFHAANVKRIAHGKGALPLDRHLLEALASGLPDCCGVAVGFDRLLALHCKENTLLPILLFQWNIA
jgi:lysyl-tRNA synthetase class 2